MLACTLGLVMAATGTAHAVIDGEQPGSAPSWTAYITSSTFFGLVETGSCTGSLVAPSWVLTAAHCVANLNDGGYTTGKPKSMTVEIGRTDGKRRGTRFGVKRIEIQGYRELSSPGGLDQDVALLELDKASTAKPLPILPGQRFAADGTEVTLYGYGYTRPLQQAEKAHEKAGTLRRTRLGTTIVDTDCSWATHGRICLLHRTTSRGGAGDSGGPWVVDVDGTPMQAAVFTGYLPQDLQQYGEALFDADTLPWLRQFTGIPVPVPGRIVRDPATSASWLIDADGFRRHIPDGGVYLCLVEQGAQVTNLARAGIDLMPMRSQVAECGAGKILLAGPGENGTEAAFVGATLQAAGYVVETRASLPDSLDAYRQVWWFDAHVGPTTTETQQLQAFLAGGGGVYLTGERPCCEQLNDADQVIVGAVLTDSVHVGDLGDPGGPVTVNAGAVGGAATTPHAITSWSPAAPGGMSGVDAENVFASADGVPVAAVWDESDMTSGTGRLAIFMDINWVQDGFRAGDADRIVINLARFLAA